MAFTLLEYLILSPNSSKPKASTRLDQLILRPSSCEQVSCCCKAQKTTLSQCCFLFFFLWISECPFVLLSSPCLFIKYFTEYFLFHKRYHSDHSWKELVSCFPLLSLRSSCHVLIIIFREQSCSLSPLIRMYFISVHFVFLLIIFLLPSSSSSSITLSVIYLLSLNASILSWSIKPSISIHSSNVYPPSSIISILQNIIFSDRPDPCKDKHTDTQHNTWPLSKQHKLGQEATQMSRMRPCGGG